MRIIINNTIYNVPVTLMVEIMKMHIWPSVLRKMQNPGLHNGPPMVDGWVARLSSGVGVTKAPFVNFSVTGNFDLAKV